MQNCIAQALVLAIAGDIVAKVQEKVDEALSESREELEQACMAFLSEDISPHSTFDFETKLAKTVRELGRRLVEKVGNVIEPADADDMPHDLMKGNEGHRVLKAKTANRNVGTLFGTITLNRFGYRSWDRDSGSPVIFPLELQMGLMAGATPALAERVGWYMAAAGATQRRVLSDLKSHHAISWGPERLRDLTQQLAQDLSRHTVEQQADRLLEFLTAAAASPGRKRPVLAVGRDGVTLREYKFRFFETASVGTVTVYDRRGHRLGSVYLGFVPESKQGSLSARLTALVREVLRRWDGPLPELAYVTDAGDNETQYYQQVLRRMKHPRTEARLNWTRVVDYYHASQRLWTMAEALFGPQSPAGKAWARRMCHLLKEPNGPSRVLHSAGALRSTAKLSKTRAANFERAANYIRERTDEMRYHDFKKRGLPIGSGVTEAACKTVVTQRLKLSGMRWKRLGAQPILDLRTLVLSGIWHATYRRHLKHVNVIHTRAYRIATRDSMQIAA